MALFAVKDILPNPFRHIKRYPIRKDKVAALRESLKTTGFWGNVVARSRNGKAEIAYGHHRLFALKEEYGPNYKVDLIIRNLSDDAMLQMMARENMEEWGTSASVEHETIRAVVEAYANDLVTLPPVSKTANKSQMRYAPLFTAGGDAPRARAEHPYTAQTLAAFIGWLQPSGEPQDKVYSALTALQFIEEGLLRESDFEGLTTKQAEAVVSEARKARDRREASARVQKMQAEEAKREAAYAEERRQEAERQRRLREAAAAAATGAEARRKATNEAKKFDVQRKEAEQQRRDATTREQQARKQEKVFVQQARTSATTVGRAVSAGLKTGKIGYRQAADVALKAEGPRQRVPPDIEDYTRRLASDINTILEASRDPRVKRLQEVLKFVEYLSDYTRADIAKTLEIVAERARDYASQFSGKTLPEARRLLSGRS